jgi:hypothetical protein
MVRRGKSRLNAVIGKVELVQKDLSGNPTTRPSDRRQAGRG